MTVKSKNLIRMKIRIKLTLIIFVYSITCFSQNSIKHDLKGMYFTNVEVENYENGEASKVVYYLFFGEKDVTLNFSKNQFAICEGKYFYKEKNEILYLIRDENDGRPCPALEDKEDKAVFSNDSEIIAIEKIKDQFYVKSKRFYTKKWNLLQPKKKI